MGLKLILLDDDNDQQVPPIIYNPRLYMSAITAAAAAMLIGYDSAFLGGTLSLPGFREEFELNHKSPHEVDKLEANIVSFYQVGCFVGALLAYPSGHFYGRKLGLLFAIVIFVIGAVLIMIASRQLGLGLIYAGRVLCGLGIGMISNLTPIYIAEISVPSIRGRLVGLYELGWQIGGIVGFWINYGISENHSIRGRTEYLIPFGVQLIPAGLALLGLLFFLRESPRWLLSRGKRTQALKNLSWLRNLEEDDTYVQCEFCMMESNLSQQTKQVKDSFWSPFGALLGNQAMRIRLVIACLLFLFQNGTGINAVNYYSPKVFRSIGIKGTSGALLSTGVFGVIKTAVTFIWLLFIADNVDRTIMLMIGAFFGGLMMFGLGVYVGIEKPLEHPSNSLTSAGIGALVMFYIWTAFYTPTWNPTPWVWASEAFPIHVRTLAQAFVAASNWFFNFLVVRFTPQMFSSMNFGVYFFFGSMMMVSIIYVKLFVPELRGVPLESVDEVFQNHFSSRRFSVLRKYTRRLSITQQ